MIPDYLYKGNIETFNVFTKKKKEKKSFSLEEKVRAKFTYAKDKHL